MGYGGSRRLPLFFLSFSAQLTMDMIAMTAPLLALSLSASPFEIGLLATSKGIVYGILPFAMGHLSDRAERRSLLASSMSIYAIVAILFYLSKSPIELIALRFFEGLAMAIFWPTIEPLFAEARGIDISKSLRGFNLSWGLGQIVGPFLGGVLITAFGARSPFLLAL
ncbi:MAG: MFS transporter, partial [Candidatus Bathyarchaeia archaeon]